MVVPFSQQELADFLFDRIIVRCPTCPDTNCLRIACADVAGELIEDANILYKIVPVSDGGA